MTEPDTRIVKEKGRSYLLKLILNAVKNDQSIP